MTRHEVLTNIVCAYIQGCGSFPKLDSKGQFNPAWYATVEAICDKYPEEDNQENCLMSATDYETYLKTRDINTDKALVCEDRGCGSVNRHYDY